MAINTPCIGICSTVYGDAICRGCKRHFHEVIHWNAYSDDKKKFIYQRLAEQTSSIIFNYIELLDASLLQAKILELNISLHPFASPAEQAFHLLRLGADKIKHLDRYGLSIKPLFAHVSLSELFNQIDAEIYASASKEHAR